MNKHINQTQSTYKNQVLTHVFRKGKQFLLRMYCQTFRFTRAIGQTPLAHDVIMIELSVV